MITNNGNKITLLGMIGGAMVFVFFMASVTAFAIVLGFAMGG